MKKFINSHPAVKGLILITSMLLTYLAGAWLFDSKKAAIVLVASVFLHELGHLVAMRIFGFKSSMLFVPLLGAMVVPHDQEGFKKQNRAKEVAIAIAGPLTNVGLAIIGLILSLVPAYHNDGLMLAALNSSLAAFNLLPFGFLDGGRIAKAIFASLNEEDDRFAATAITIASFAVMIVIFVFSGKALLLPIFLVWGARRASMNDDPAEYTHARSMKRQIALNWTYIYCGSLAVSLMVLGLLQNWTQYYS